MKKNVLLIDDDSICNFINRKIILASAMISDIQVVLNGKEAIQLFKNAMAGIVSMPDVIFLDLNMPIMNGVEFVNAFRKLEFPGKESILTVVLTSSIDTGDIRNVEELGIPYFLNKPITTEDITSLFQKEFGG